LSPLSSFALQRATRRRVMLWPLAAGMDGCAGAAPGPSVAPPSAPGPSVAPPSAARLPSLTQAFGAALPFGVAVMPAQLRGPESAFIAHHFNLLVAENAMKPEALAPVREAEYDFAAADALVDFASAHDMKVRGHTLMWHRQMPPWFFKDGAGTVSREQLIARIERYIADVVGHFKGRVYAWAIRAWPTSSVRSMPTRNSA
jgi:Glycosyl hydrolase family 10